VLVLILVGEEDVEYRISRQSEKEKEAEQD
jgi:hypothetical protein